MVIRFGMKIDASFSAKSEMCGSIDFESAAVCGFSPKISVRSCTLRGRGATGSRGSIDPPLFQVRGPHMVLEPSLFVRFFSLSRPVSPKHNPCSCRMMFRCCPAMAREQILTESINLSTMELWNSLPDNLRHLDLSLGQFRRALKTHLF